MRIYTKAGDLAFKTFTFPDGQPHFKLETYEIDFTSATVETAIKSPSDLFTVGLVAQTLRQHGYHEINLDVRYLMGARMDRAIDSMQPYTLMLVAQTINGMGFNRVRILDVHSEVALRLIRNSENVLPTNVVKQVLNTLGPVSVAIPDKGATDRVRKLCEGVAAPFQCLKKRDMNTGDLSGFEADYSPHATPGRLQNQYNVLIVDDICDGGGTFVGLADVLRKAGARKVYLFVTHGIFSKGGNLAGIDHIYTTDSFLVERGQVYNENTITTIPVSMKEMK